MSLSAKIGKIVSPLFPLMIIVGIGIGVVCIMVQQVHRQLANDPQIQIVEDLVASYNAGQAPPAAGEVSEPTVDFAKSLSTFVTLYDIEGNVIVSTGAIAGETQKVPYAVLESARSGGQYRVTWEPKQGVRVAAVVEYYKNDTGEGFVLAGRSLRETEARINKAYMLAGAVLFIVFVLSIAVKSRVIHEMFGNILSGVSNKLHKIRVKKK